jgi:hypothetical protein
VLTLLRNARRTTATTTIAPPAPQPTAVCGLVAPVTTLPRLALGQDVPTHLLNAQ